MFFELFTHHAEVTTDAWRTLFRKLERNMGVFDKSILDIHFTTEQILFYLHTKRDFSKMSNEFLPFILDTQADIPAMRYKSKSWYWINISPKETVLSFKERYEFRRQSQLKRVFCSINTFLFFRWYTVECFFQSSKGVLYIGKKRFLTFPYNFLHLDFSQIVKYKKKTVPIYVKLQKTLALFGQRRDEGFLEVDGFPYLDERMYLNLNSYELNKHSLIVGQTGTGKSKFIELFIKQLEKHKLTDEYTVVVIDPHASMYPDFVGLPNNINVDFLRTACKLFAQIGEPKVATELTILLFKTLMKDQFNPKMERVLKYTLFALFTTNTMSLETLKRFLTEVVYRKEILNHELLTESIKQFFETDYLELETKFYELAVMPILTLLDELAFLPISNFQESDSLKDIIEQHSLVFLSLNKIMLGEKATKLIAGLLIQQLFLLAQSKVFNKKLLFIIDEVSVVQNDALSSILSEARKFNLSLFLTQQYLGQVEQDLLKSIITNVYNYFIFKISEEDAKLLVNNIEFEFTDEVLKTMHDWKAPAEEVLRVRMITQLNPRECVVRVYNSGKFFPVFKAKTLTI